MFDQITCENLPFLVWNANKNSINQKKLKKRTVFKALFFELKKNILNI